MEMLTNRYIQTTPLRKTIPIKLQHQISTGQAFFFSGSEELDSAASVRRACWSEFQA